MMPPPAPSLLRSASKQAPLSRLEFLHCRSDLDASLDIVFERIAGDGANIEFRARVISPMHIVSALFSFLARRYRSKTRAKFLHHSFLAAEPGSREGASGDDAASGPLTFALGAFKLGPKTQLLIGVLDELATVLESDGDSHWSGWMRKARARLLNSDYSGIEYLLSAYGGMGSLNDVVLGQTYKNGVFEWKPGHVELNEKFTALSSKAWELADAIKRSQ